MELDVKKEGKVSSVDVGQDQSGRIKVKEMFPWKQLCPGHERAMLVERTVMEFDVKEEGKCPLLM